MAVLTKNEALVSALATMSGLVRSLLLHVLLLGILPMVEGLLDLHLEVAPVHHVLLDLVDWQLDEHTRDLWSLVVANEALDVLVDAATDLLLQVWVVWVQGWDVLGRGLQVPLLDRHVVWIHLLHLGHHWHAWSAWLLVLHWHWLLLLNHSLLWRHLLTHLSHLSWVHWRLLLVHALVTWVHVLTHATLVVLDLVLSWASVLVSSSLLSVDLALELLVGSLVVLDDTEQLLEHLSQVRL